jgi:stage V sporulation protein B
MAAQGYSEKEYTSLLGMFNGQYDTITNIPLSLASALAASFMPSLVATIQTGNKKQIYNKLNMVSRFNMIIAIPCAVGLIALARPVLDLLFYTQNNEIPAMLLRIGAISVVFFCLSTVTNAALQGMDKMSKPVKNAAISLVIHIVALLIMLIVFKWNIYSIVLSKIIFAAAICVLNAHDLREACGYVQERKQTFIIPAIASIIMGVVAMGVQFVLGYLIGDKIATIFAIMVAVAVYAVTMIIMGGITEAELLGFPKGYLLVKVFKKIRLLKSE